MEASKTCNDKKPKKTCDAKQYYRPICLQNGLEKLHQSIINNRLQTEIRYSADLVDSQPGFRERKSNVGALERVKKIADFTNSGNVRRRNCFLVVVPWKGIVKVLNNIHINPHVTETCKVSQGSISGPTL